MRSEASEAEFFHCIERRREEERRRKVNHRCGGLHVPTHTQLGTLDCSLTGAAEAEGKRKADAEPIADAKLPSPLKSAVEITGETFCSCCYCQAR
jgi:hypothetical protein